MSEWVSTWYTYYSAWVDGKHNFQRNQTGNSAWIFYFVFGYAPWSLSCYVTNVWQTFIPSFEGARKCAEAPFPISEGNARCPLPNSPSRRPQLEMVQMTIWRFFLPLNFCHSLFRLPKQWSCSQSTSHVCCHQSRRVMLSLPAVAWRFVSFSKLVMVTVTFHWIKITRFITRAYSAGCSVFKTALH